MFDHRTDRADAEGAAVYWRATRGRCIWRRRCRCRWSRFSGRRIRRATGLTARTASSCATRASPTTHARRCAAGRGNAGDRRRCRSRRRAHVAGRRARAADRSVRSTWKVRMAEGSRQFGQSIVGQRLRAAFACRWDLRLRCCTSGWRGPAWRFLAIGAISIVPGLLIRALASGHVRKNEALATSGPYAYTRNPLYLGSLLMGVGFAIAARSWWVGVDSGGDVFAIYLPVIRDEESYPAAEVPGVRGICAAGAEDVSTNISER